MRRPRDPTLVLATRARPLPRYGDTVFVDAGSRRQLGIENPANLADLGLTLSCDVNAVVPPPASDVYEQHFEHQLGRRPFS